MTIMRPTSTSRVCYLAVGLRDRITRRAAWLLPRRVAYWAAIRVAAHATTGPYSGQIVPGVTVTEMIERWDPTGRAVEFHDLGAGRQ